MLLRQWVYLIPHPAYDGGACRSRDHSLAKTLEATPFKYFFSLKRKARYDFTLIIYFNASSIKLVTLLTTKHEKAKELGSGVPRVNQMYPSGSIFYVLHSILCTTIKHLASKRLLCLQNNLEIARRIIRRQIEPVLGGLLKAASKS